MENVKNFINRKAIDSKFAFRNFLNRGKDVVKNKSGLSETVEKMLWIIGVCAVVALVIGLFIAFTNDEFMPMVKDKVKEILNMK